MKVSKGESQPQKAAAAFLVLYMVLIRPFKCQDLIMTHLLRTCHEGPGQVGPGQTGPGGPGGGGPGGQIGPGGGSDPGSFGGGPGGFGPCGPGPGQMGPGGPGGCGAGPGGPGGQMGPGQMGAGQRGPSQAGSSRCACATMLCECHCPWLCLRRAISSVEPMQMAVGPSPGRSLPRHDRNASCSSFAFSGLQDW